MGSLWLREAWIATYRLSLLMSRVKWILVIGQHQLGINSSLEKGSDDLTVRKFASVVGLYCSNMEPSWIVFLIPLENKVFLSPFIYFFFIEVQLICNLVLVLRVQKSDSITYICIHIYMCWIYLPVIYSRPLLVICFTYISAYMLIPNYPSVLYLMHPLSFKYPSPLLPF